MLNYITTYNWPSSAFSFYDLEGKSLRNLYVFILDSSSHHKEYYLDLFLYIAIETYVSTYMCKKGIMGLIYFLLQMVTRFSPQLLHITFSSVMCNNCGLRSVYNLR